MTSKRVRWVRTPIPPLPGPLSPPQGVISPLLQWLDLAANVAPGTTRWYPFSIRQGYRMLSDPLPAVDRDPKWIRACWIRFSHGKQRTLPGPFPVIRFDPRGPLPRLWEGYT